MRHPGRILEVEEGPPAAMVAYVAEQLEVDTGAFGLYSRRYHTRFDHSHRLAHYLGVRTATREDRCATLAAAINAARVTDQGPLISTVVVNAFRERGALLLPDGAVETIGIAGRAIVRQRAETALLEGMSADQLHSLDALLTVDPAIQQTRVSWLRTAPDATRTDNLIGLMERLSFIRSMAVEPQRREQIHPER